MPREGVPYPERLLCSLRCELRNIWNALNGKLHSVNGVEGDGAGNVNIVSGDAAVTVTPDASLNRIEVSLDRSQLPSAAVTSVNGETGAVVLDASEIDSGVLALGNSVQDDIGSMYTQVRGINSGLTAETNARINADAALQNSINTLQASIPSAAADAVAADPTVTQLASDVSALQTADANNVKLSGSQTITGNKSVPIEATGSYSQQIANSQKVKNELDNYAPMVRTSGNQTIGGNKNFNTPGTFARPMTITNPSMDASSTTAIGRSWIWIADTNNNPVFIVQFVQEGNTREVRIRTFRSDGTYNQQVIASA